MLLSTTLTLLISTLSVSAKILYAGVSESGGEFGVYSTTATPGTGLPGRFGVDYAFINKTTVDILVKQNVNVFRVAFLLERMCPLAYGLGAKFNETHFGFYKDAIDYITVKKGAYAVFDPHNYMRLTRRPFLPFSLSNDPSQQPATGSIIGDTSDPKAATTAQFASFWGELARRFKDNEKVIFGLVNEPHDMSTALVLKNDNAAIAAIRKAGAKQLILAPGNGYTGGHAWLESSQGDEPSGNYLQKIYDPIGNTAMEVHEYLDYNFSGSHIACNQSFESTMGPLTNWLKEYKLKAFVGEFGGSNTTACYGLLENAITYMNQNDVYIGWAAWAAGPLWGTAAPCCNDGNNWGSLEPGSKAADGGPSFYDTVWRKIIQPRIPVGTLKKSGVSGLK